MGHIYRNLRAIPFPAQAKLNRYDNKISIYRTENGKRRRTVIGALESEEERTMIPNDNFRIKFPELWRQYYGEQMAPLPRICVGLYALTLAIGCESGLYSILQQSFGPQYANALMDYAMYSIHDRNSAAQLFEQAMEEQMLFARKPLSESWYSNLFSVGMTSEMTHAFRTKWLERSAAVVRDVWLCIDGSNNDCAVSDSKLAGMGHAKSHRQVNIVSYIWAVSAVDGRPVTWFVNNGGMPDCKAVDEIIRFLSRSSINVRGVILDRGFACKEVLDLITARAMSYVVMLTSGSSGYAKMMQRHAEEIRWKMNHFVAPGLFGITDEVEIFSSSTAASRAALYFVGMRSTSQTIKLMKEVIDAAKQVKAQIAANPQTASIPAGMRKYLKLRKVDDLAVDVEYDFSAWQKDADGSGYHVIACSEPYTAEQIHALYKLKSVSEKQFRQLKSELDGATTRVHSDQSICSRLATCFIASIIRTELELKCEQLGFDTNEMIRRMDSAYLLRMPNGSYEEIHNLSNKYKMLFESFGITMGHFAKFAEEINTHETSTVYSQVRKMPSVEIRRPGRPKGSKNKKTLLREAWEAETGYVAPPKRKPGRPKGSRNKATIERELAAAQSEQPPKRGPGRPKGSKNKKTLEREALQAARALAAQQPKRKPGRPKGSKNKATLERKAREAEALAASRKRGPGRPKGSRNKTKPVEGGAQKQTAVTGEMPVTEETKTRARESGLRGVLYRSDGS